MKQVKVLVLGGGLAGVQGALAVQKTLRRRQAVTLVSASPRLELRQSLVRLAFGLKKEGESTVDLSEALEAKGISAVQAQVTQVNAAKSIVETTAGNLQYGYLLVALGAKRDASGVRGSENAFSLNSLHDANKARVALQNFSQGSFCSIASQGNKWEGPALETILHAHAFFKQKGVRGEIELHYATSKKRPFDELGNAVSAAIEKELAVREIHLHAGEEVVEITGEHVLTRKRRIPANLLFLFPAHAGSDALSGSGLCDERNFILVDGRMRSRAFKNVFAAGDCVNSLSLKLGFNALSGAAVAGDNIARELLGKQLKKFVPKIVYAMELGGGEALLITASWSSGKWKAAVRKGGIPYLRKLAFEKTFLQEKGFVHYVLGEKLG